MFLSRVVGMDQCRFTMAFLGGEVLKRHRWGQGFTAKQGSAPNPNCPQRLTEWDRLNNKLHLEDEIKRSLFKPPDSFAIEV